MMTSPLNITVTPEIDESWKKLLLNEFNSAYFKELKQFLLREKSAGKIIHPAGKNIFSAFNHTPFDRLKVVIIGQDPYHGPGQANGLCFSVSDGVPQPPSLKNIFKELHQDLGIEPPLSGNLEKWAEQGVLLLNATLTVENGLPGSHQNQGWEQFTNAVIRLISEEKEGIVFLLWGKFAQAKEDIIDSGKHFLLKAAHPSPFSAYNGFMGCKHFSKVNEILKQTKRTPIDWRL